MGDRGVANVISLKALVQAITSAISAAQSEVDRQQVTTLSEYFDDNLRPRVMRMRLPSLRPDDNGAEIIHAVPVLTLVSPSQLRIKEVEFQFRVAMGDISAHRDIDGHPTLDDFNSSFRVLSIDPAPGVFGRRRPTAKVSVKVESCDQSEGLARMIGELNKYHGEYKVDGENDAASPPNPKESNGSHT